MGLNEANDKECGAVNLTASAGGEAADGSDGRTTRQELLVGEAGGTEGAMDSGLEGTTFCVARIDEGIQRKE